MKKLIVNGKRAGGRKLSALAAAFNSSRIRTEKGGYLFKAGSDDKFLYMGVVPCFVEGQRTHHYDIELPSELTEVIIGNLNPEGVFTLLFIPEQKVLTDKQKTAYRRVYADFAAGMIGIGIRPDACADQVTAMMLDDSGLMPGAALPLTLADIAAYDRSTPRKS